jgi:hypothetical protein
VKPTPRLRLGVASANGVLGAKPDMVIDSPSIGG